MRTRSKKQDDQSPSVRSAVKAIRKLSVKPGDILLVKEGTDIAENLQDVLAAMARAGHTQVVVVITSDDDPIQKFDKRKMNEAGWYHLDQIRSKTRLGRRK